MNFKFIIICIIQFFCTGITFAQNEAKITFKSKLNSFYAVTEKRGGNSFGIYSNRGEKNTNVTVTKEVPEMICTNSLLWVNVDGACSWIKLLPNDAITVWAENGKLMSADSKNQQINNYLNDWSQMAYFDIRNNLLYRIDGMSAVRMPVKREETTVKEIFSDENITKMETIYERSMKQLKEAKIKDKLFVEKQKGRIAMQAAELFSTAIAVAREDIVIPQRVYDFMDKVNFNLPSIQTYPGFDDVTRTYFTLLYDFGKIDYEVSRYLSIRAKKLKNADVIERYVLNELISIHSNAWTYRVDEILADAQRLIKSESGRVEFDELKAKINQLSDEMSVNVGVVCDDFEFADRNGKMVKLSDFKGKYVFVDVWATWCSPCKYEIPYLLKLEKELHGKDIQFISLSVDQPSNRQAWLNYIEKNDMNGVCLITPDAFNHPLMKRYDIKTIPRFLLFDKEGRTISIRNRRPHDPIMKQQLLELLK